MLELSLNLLIALILTILATAIILPIMQKNNFGQEIRELGPESHQAKEGIPTMGGLIFFPVLPVTAIFTGQFSFSYSMALLPILIMWVLGIADDYLIIRRSSSEGISGFVKLFVQAGAGFFLGAFMYYSGAGQKIILPFLAESFEPGAAIIPFAMIVMMATTNSVNLSDGLDGLAAGLIAISLLFFLPVLIFAGYNDLAVLAVQGTGIMLGFLWFNFYPARIFMGDTGSLTMGAVLTVVALLSGHGLFLLILGGVFVLEALSVIIQVSYFKISGGNRIFKMTPLHHHFELSGWPETRVTIRLYILQILFGFFGLLAG